MKISCCWLRRQIAIGLIVVLAVPSAEAIAEAPQQSLTYQQPQAVSSDQDHSQVSGSQVRKPSSDRTQSKDTAPEIPDPVPSQDAGQTPQSTAPQPGSEPPRNGAQKPVGTAAAPYEKTTGVAASRPAGAVIAPAKQRRARSFLIRISVVVGAAVAIGTVVALSRGSSSRP